MTCSEWNTLKAQTEADLARATVELQAAELDTNAAQQDVMIAMNDLGSKQIIESQKQAEVDSKQSTLNYINMMMQMQGC